MSALSDDLDKIEESTFRLQKDWDKFFSGLDKKAPHEARQRLDRLVRKYVGAEIPNNADRFRFQSLAARYNTLSDLWNRRLRAIEEGRSIAGYRPTMKPVSEVSVEKPPPVIKSEVRISTLREDEDGVSRLYDQFQAARKSTGEPGLKLDAFRKLIAQHRVRLLEEKDAVAVDFRISSEGGKVSLKAKPIRT
jgi:hypothetical protein